MKNSFQIIGTLVVLSIYFFATKGCDPSAMNPTVQPSRSESVVHQNPAVTSIIMGSFNIQVFGRAKFGNTDVMKVLVDVARRFDILAIQELRSTDQSLIPQFVEMINADGSKFDFWVGPRQGYTISTEQYVYLYDSTKLGLIEEPFVAPAPEDSMHRSPLVARFRCLTEQPERAFTFSLLNIHVDPDEVPLESATLVSVIDNVRRLQPDEDDFILLGDVNSPPSYFQSFRWFNNQLPAIADEWATKTAQDLNRDNIVFDAINTGEFLNRSGVLNLMQEYGISVDDALIVSDHMPVWALFSTTEAAAPQMAEELPPVIR